MKVIVLAALVALTSAIQFDTTLDETWATFKAKFYRLYDEEQEQFRRAVFESTVAYIVKHNFEADLGMHTYTLGINEFSDWTNEEFQRLLGFRAPNVNESLTVPEYMPPLNSLPPSNDVDWRSQGYVTPIKNQGSCGSCWSFSSTGALEGQQYRKTKQLKSLSEQQLVDCTRSYGNQGCNGGWMNNAFQYVIDLTKRSQFLDISSCYAYRGVDGTCNPNFAASCSGSTCAAYTNVGRSEASLASALQSVGPVSVAIDASKPSFQSYKSGVYSDPTCTGASLNHAVLAVGFTSSPNAWIVKNSWGTTWGAAGYIQMARGSNICGIANSASYPTV